MTGFDKLKRGFLEKHPGTARSPRPWLIYGLITVAFYFITRQSLTSSMAGRAVRELAVVVDSVSAGGNPFRRFSLLGFGLFGVFGFFWKKNHSVRPQGALGWFILLFISWSVLSVLWSVDPRITIRRLGTLTLLSAGIAGLLRWFSLRSLVELLVFMTGTYLLVGFLAELAYGTFRPWASGYRFAGTLDPNTQAENCAVLALGAAYVALVDRRKRGLWLGVLIGAVMFLGLTKARTPAASGLAALLFFWSLRRRPSVAVIAALFLSSAALVFVLLFVNGVIPVPWDIVLLGRGNDLEYSATLSGRIGLWRTVLPYIMQRPLVGFGYHAFETPQNPAMLRVVSTIGVWAFGGLHSAYIEVLAGLGFVGLGLFVCILLLALLKARRHGMKSSDPEYVFLGSVVLFAILDGLLETLIIYPQPPLYVGLILGTLGFRAFGSTGYRGNSNSRTTRGPTQTL